MWIWGDDTMIAVGKGFNEDAYVAESARLGYVTKLSTAPVFLMTMFPKHGPATNLASRTYAQSIWREHEQQALPLTLFGLWVRFGLLAGHPFFSTTWSAVAKAARPDGVLEARGIRSFADLDAHIRSATFTAELAAALKTDPATGITLWDSLTRGGEGAADNPDAAYALALLGHAAPGMGKLWTAPLRLSLAETKQARHTNLDTAISAYMGWLDKAQEQQRYGKQPTAPGTGTDEERLAREAGEAEYSEDDE